MMRKIFNTKETTVDELFNVYNELRINFLLNLLEDDYGNFELDKIPNMEFSSQDFKILQKCKSFEEFYKYLSNKKTIETNDTIK